ncbi:hypothetical protein N9Z47_01760 [bacterium]|nr:hypothetical protein [bacterium]
MLEQKKGVESAHFVVFVCRYWNLPQITETRHDKLGFIISEGWSQHKSGRSGGILVDRASRQRVKSR